MFSLLILQSISAARQVPLGLIFPFQNQSASRLLLLLLYCSYCLGQRPDALARARAKLGNHSCAVRRGLQPFHIVNNAATRVQINQLNGGAWIETLSGPCLLGLLHRFPRIYISPSLTVSVGLVQEVQQVHR